MNYLAHLYLARGNTGLVVGGFLADFVKGPLRGEYPDNIEAGMRLHRRIDYWSDQHSAIKNIRGILPKQFGRYTGIIADVLGDHFLAKDWASNNRETIDHFAKNQLSVLQTHRSIFPKKANLVLDKMASGNWLTNYHNLNYSVGALERIGQRLTRKNPLHETEQPILRNYDQLEKLCSTILRDLSLNVAEWRAEKID